jgi:ABC-type glycerol-3-phosphate transport system permease component
VRGGHTLLIERSLEMYWQFIGSLLADYWQLIRSESGGAMKSLAMTAVAVLIVAVLGGPLTYYLARFRPRENALFCLHRIFTTLLGFVSTLMGFTLMVAHVSIFIRILGALGLASAVLGIQRLYKKRRTSRR